MVFFPNELLGFALTFQGSFKNLFNLSVSSRPFANNLLFGPPKVAVKVTFTKPAT